MKKRIVISLMRSARTVPPKKDNLSSSSGSHSAGRRRGANKSYVNNNGYSLKWNLQSQHILNELGKIYLSGEEEEGEGLADVMLFSREGDCVQAHKIVLILCSPYFHKLFLQVSKNRKKDADNAIVILGNLSSAHLRNLVRFMYTGEVNMSSTEEVEEFEGIAKMFGIDGVSTSTFEVEQAFSFDEAQAKKKRSSYTAQPVPVEKVPSQAKQLKETFLSFQNEQTNENNDEGINTVNASVDDENLESITCKIEPGDDLPSGEDNDDFYSQPNNEDDACSNFSDQLPDDRMISDDEDDDNSNDPDIAFGFRKSNKKKKGAIISSRRGRVSKAGTRLINGWTRIDPISEEDLAKNWRRKNRFECKTNVTVLFYCHLGGNNCPATLRTKTLTDGTTLYFKNKFKHANHLAPEDPLRFGLSQEQKQFVFECVKKGVTRPSNINLKCELEGRSMIPIKKLRNFLDRQKKMKGWKEYWIRRDPKWPKRIRMKPSSKGEDETPKKLDTQLKEEEGKEVPCSTASISHQAQALPATSTNADPGSSTSLLEGLPLSSSAPNPPHYKKEGQPFSTSNTPTIIHPAPPEYQYDNSFHR